MASFGDNDLVMNYDWTSVPRGSGLRSKAPKVELKCYKVVKNEALNRLRNYMEVFEGDPMTYYRNLYNKSTQYEEAFYLPYFGDSVRSFSNEYGDTFQAGFLGNIDNFLKSSADELGALGSSLGMVKPAIAGADAVKKFSNDLQNTSLSDSLGSFGRGIASMGKNMTSSPGSYIETPKIYQYANNDAPLNIDLVLYNTINDDFMDKNVKFVEKMIRMNRPKRINAVEMEPPYIYNVRIPGLRYMEWAYCNSLDVRMLGTKRIIDDKVVPEAYMINISLASLTVEVSNFMDKI